MPRITKPEFAGDLTAVFIPLEPRSLSPDEVSSTLQLTHSFLTGTHKFRQNSQVAITGAANGLIVQLAVPPDKFWYVSAAGVNSNDSVAQRYSIAMTPATGGQNIPIVSDDAPVVRNVLSFARPLNRSFLLGPGALLIGIVGALTAGTQLSLTASIVEMNLLETHPHF